MIKQCVSLVGLITEYKTTNVAGKVPVSQSGGPPLYWDLATYFDSDCRNNTLGIQVEHGMVDPLNDGPESMKMQLPENSFDDVDNDDVDGLSGRTHHHSKILICSVALTM